MVYAYCLMPTYHLLQITNRISIKFVIINNIIQLIANTIYCTHFSFNTVAYIYIYRLLVTIVNNGELVRNMSFAEIQIFI